MSISIIDQVVEQLSSMTLSMQSEVLKFTRTLIHSEVQGVSGQKLLRFAGAIPFEDLQLMQTAIEQGCEQVDFNEW